MYLISKSLKPLLRASNHEKSRQLLIAIDLFYHNFDMNLRSGFRDFFILFIIEDFWKIFNNVFSDKISKITPKRFKSWWKSMNIIVIDLFYYKTSQSKMILPERNIQRHISKDWDATNIDTQRRQV